MLVVIDCNAYERVVGDVDEVLAEGLLAKQGIAGIVGTTKSMRVDAVEQCQSRIGSRIHQGFGLVEQLYGGVVGAARHKEQRSNKCEKYAGVFH